MADAAAALQWDLVPRMSPYLDRHLILALLEHLEDIQVRTSHTHRYLSLLRPLAPAMPLYSP